MSSKLAVIIIPPPPTPSAPPSTNCAYQVYLGSGDYQCMTAETYREYKAEEYARDEAGVRLFIETVRPVAIVLGIAMIVLAVITIIRLVIEGWRKYRG